MLGENQDDLSLRECIYGKIKLMDYDGEKRIHSSDFQSAVEQLGLKYSDPAVSSVLIKCKVGMDGFIDYSPLEAELEAERYYASKKAQADKEKRQLTNHGQSSSGTMNDGMFDGGELHDQRAQCEKNRQVLQRSRDDLKAGWLKYTHSEISREQFVKYVEFLNMVPTVSFKDNVRKQGVDIPFKDVFISLSQVDPLLFTTNLGDKLRTDSERGAIASSGRRHFYDKTDYTLNPFSDSRTEKRANKFDRSVHGNRTLNSSQVGDSMKASHAAGGRSQAQFITQNRAVENAMVLAGTSTTPVSGMPAVGSRRTGPDDRLVAGHTSLANAQSLGEDVCYTSEVRILREQTLVALRQVDEGSMSGVEFVDRLYQLGLILPEAVIAMVQRRGDIDYKACVKALDAEVFMKRAIHGRASQEEISNARSKLLAALQRRGSSDSVAALGRSFRIMDDNNDKRLSFGEFRKGCRDFGVDTSITDESLRLLFNHFDKDGNGYLSYDELLVAIRGELSPKRSAWVKAAFQKLDKNGDGTATVEDLVGVYDTSAHPDVLSGKKNSIDVLRSILDQFDTAGEEDGIVTESEFLNYYGAISASIDHDDAFVEMIKKSWKVDEIKPPARTARISAQDKKMVHLNMADRMHGDILNWSNGSSFMDEEDSRRENEAGVSNSRFKNKGMRGGAHGLGHHDSSLNVFKMEKAADGSHVDGVPNEEWLAAGAIRLKRHPNHKAVQGKGSDILSWPGASGGKEHSEDVRAMLEAARVDEESRLFPKGPRLNSSDVPASAGSKALAALASSARQANSGERVAGKVSTGDEFEAHAGEIYFGPRIHNSQLRQRDYQGSCPFGYDGPSTEERESAARAAPASAGGPTIGHIQKHSPRTHLNHAFTDPNFRAGSPVMSPTKGTSAATSGGEGQEGRPKQNVKSLSEIMAARG